jgi:hypothetical protein
MKEWSASIPLYCNIYNAIFPCAVSTSWSQQADATLQTRRHTQKVVLQSFVFVAYWEGVEPDSSSAL